MTSVKPKVGEREVSELLRQLMPGHVEQLENVSGGQIAQTFSFIVGGEAYILRLAAHMGANLEKELCIQRLLTSSPVPFPPILHVGRHGELHYAISRRMPGTPLTQLSQEAYELTIPALLKTLDDIHGVDVSETWGYGTFGDDGRGFFPSWRSYLAAIRHEEPEWEFYGKWHTLFETTFLERDFWEALYAQMLRLLDFCPEERCLVHGDYGYTNVLSIDGRITAVLDWLDAKYGDFLFDVAGLDIWDPARDMSGHMAAYYSEKGAHIPHYAERVLCYECYIALDALRFFAKTHQRNAYRWIRERISAKLAQFQGSPRI